MKTIAILLLTTSIVSAAMPFALAASCATQPPQEQLDATEDLLPAGTYLFLSTSAPAKSGVWSEDNGRPGLQTSACVVAGTGFYGPDAKTVA